LSMLTFAWDIDDTLNDLTREWLRDYSAVKAADHSFSDLKENPPHRILGISKNEYLQSLDAFRLSPRYAELKPAGAIMDWLNSYGHRARHIALTAVPLCAAHISSQWVIKHFGKWIRTYAFIPSARSEIIPAYDESKKNFIAWIDRVDVLIEDNEQNAGDAADLGVKSFLIKKPWNNSKLSVEEVLIQLTKLVEEDNND
jgi:uncharacterized HAD superfamily protein